MSRHMSAGYPGLCMTCREPIEINDDLVKDEDDIWVHAACAASTRTRISHALPEAFCLQCHLVRPCEHDAD